MASPKSAKYFLNVFAAVLIAGAVIFYGWFRARDFIAGPVIEITAPQNGSALADPLVEVRGMAKNISEITINEKKIFTNKEGLWDETLLLHPGYNMITMKAADRFGRRTEKKLELVLKGS